MGKKCVGNNVLDAAIFRISKVFDDFPKIYVSFSAGKDSAVMLHLVIAEAQRRNRKVGVLFVDLEAQYKATIEFAEMMIREYAAWIDPYWVALPLNLRNAVSQFQPHWTCWEPGKSGEWVRDPPAGAITDEAFFPFFRRRMEFEDFVDRFGHWYAAGILCACFVGIRADESLNRWRTICGGRKSTFEGMAWTTWKAGALYNVYPIYDWRTEDVWTFNARFNAPYNRIYDLMHAAGLTIHQARICQPYGDDQRRGLWLYSAIEPETWARLVTRVSGANHGAIHCRQAGRVLGNGKIDRPPGMSWKRYAALIIETLPETFQRNAAANVAQYLGMHAGKDTQGDIPDDARTGHSWKTVVRSLLKYDFKGRGLGVRSERD